MAPYTIAAFGEAEKGEYHVPYFCRTLPELVNFLGNPPEYSRGLFFAVQALLYHRNLIFLRVREEGFSVPDYLAGLRLLQSENLIEKIAAICLPGVAENEIIEAVTPICKVHHNIIITSEADLYDYMTYSSSC